MKKISTRQKIALIIFGLFLGVVLLEIGLRIGGFVFLSLQEYRNRISIKQKGTYRIICLGESTTALGGENPYSQQLEEILNQRDIGIKFSVINKGLAGTNTTAIVSQLEDNLNKYAPDMVITMMGINDGRGTMAYEDIPIKKTTLLLKSFRTYKLAKLLRLHIVNKAREIGAYRPREKKENITLTKDDLMQPSNFKEQEKVLKKAIEINPEDEQAYFKLGWWYREQGKYDKAEEMLKKEIELNPNNDRVYTELAGWYREQGKYDRAEEMLKKTIEINPEDGQAYFELGRCYRKQGRHDKAEELFKKAIELNPERDWAYTELGRCYKEQERYDKAEEMFKKAIELNPNNDQAYFELGRCYRKQGRHDKAEEILKKAIEINPANGQAYFELGRCYKRQRKYDKAEEMFKKAIELNPERDWAYGGLAHCYEEQGKYNSAEEYFRKANRTRSEYYDPITWHNYQRLKETVTKKGIKLLCMQYPVRSVEPLKKMFENKEGIIFVDNESVFKKALKQASYDEYFKDMFGGDFGHCTAKGNRLLAENIANVILKECFNK